MKSSFLFFLRCLLCVLAVLIFQGRLSAASYYIDYSAGSDTAAGTDTTVAWKHCPGDPSATGNALAGVLKPGDTIYFKCGVTYYFTGVSGIILYWNGAAGLPITYEGGVWGFTGTNRAKFSCTYNSSGAMVGPLLNAFQGSALTNYCLTFNSLDVGPIGGSSTPQPDAGVSLPSVYGGGIVFNGEAINVTISNCYFHEEGYWSNLKPMSAGSFGGVGVSTVGFSYLTITNCEFTKMQIACEMGVSGNSSNLFISGCKYHDYIIWCIDLALRNNGCALDNVFIHNNQFYDYSKQFGAGAWQGYGGAGSWPHCDGIFHRGNNLSSFSEGTNINFYANLFYDTPPLSGGATASIFVEGSVNENIYNNLFLNPAVANGVITSGDNYQGFAFLNLIYNNTFYTCGQSSISVGGSWPLVPKSVEIDVKNNIFYDYAVPNSESYALYTTIVNSAGATNLYLDHNVYCTSNTRPAFMLWPSYGGHFNLTGIGAVENSFRKLFNWESNGIAAIPPFAKVNSTNYWTSNDYHLTLTGNAVSVNGTNLSSMKLPGLNLDYEGNPRPATGPWSAGAYQAGSSPSTASLPIIPPVLYADLLVTNTVNSSAVMTGQSVVFSLKVQNNGPTVISNGVSLIVTNQLPSGFAYVSSTGAGSFDSTSGLWTLTSGLAVNASAMLAITANSTSAGVFSNTASVTVPSGITETNLANNTSFAVVTVTNPIIRADLAVTGSVNSSAVMTGQSVVFSLKVQNNGPSVISNGVSLIVTNQLPSTFTYVSSSGTGTYNSTAGLWTLTSGLAVNASATLAITAQSTAAGAFTNTLSVMVPGGIVDASLANNIAYTAVSVTNQILNTTTTSTGSGGSTSGSTSSGSSSAPPAPSGLKVVSTGN